MKKKGVLDFTKPLLSSDSRVKGISCYGVQKTRDGQPIMDEFKFLLLIGNRQVPVYVNEFGQCKMADGALKQVVHQGAAEAETEEPPLLTKIDEAVANLILDVAQEHDAAAETRDQIEKMLKLLHDFACKTIPPIGEIRTEIKALKEYMDQKFRVVEKCLNEQAAQRGKQV